MHPSAVTKVYHYTWQFIFQFEQQNTRFGESFKLKMNELLPLYHEHRVLLQRGWVGVAIECLLIYFSQIEIQLY